MAAKKTAQTQSKSEFIRAQPASLSPADVVTKAKTQGIELSRGLVYMVRGRVTPKRGPSARPAAKAANASTASASTGISKSEFIRRLPATTSAKDAVAQGKAAGMKFDVQYVSKIRSAARTKGAAKKASATPAKKAAAAATPAKKAAKAAGRTAAQESKADFVRARAHLSPKEVVEDAVVAGVTLDASYVYNVRGYDKAVARKGRAGTKRAPVVAATRSVESLLLAVAAELGLGRAIDILQGERARVRAVIGG